MTITYLAPDEMKNVMFLGETNCCKLHAYWARLEGSEEELLSKFDLVRSDGEDDVQSPIPASACLRVSWQWHGLQVMVPFSVFVMSQLKLNLTLSSQGGTVLWILNVTFSTKCTRECTMLGGVILAWLSQQSVDSP